MEIETDLYGNAIFARAYTTYSLASAVPGPSWAATRSNLTQRVLYDPRFHQYVISATNTLGHTTLYEYYGVNEAVNTAGQPFGALKQITDPNGAVTVYQYDAFGRLRKTAAPGDTLGFPSEEIQYFDGVDTAKTDRWPLMVTRIARSVISGTWSLANMATWSRAFYDGLGREIQSQTPVGQGWAQASCNDVPPKTLGNEIIQSNLYDALGRSAVQSVPYTQSQYVYCAPSGSVTTPYVAVPQIGVTQTQPVLSGTGLAAAYYTGKDFNTLALLRTDATVDFDWGNGAPDSRVGVDLFSARWTGTVRASTSESYTFYATGDDGIRLWVNGQLLVDKWQDQGATEYSAGVPLQAGVPANIVFEYYENGGGAVAKLMWSSPTISKQIIPTTALYVPRSSMTATLTLTPSVPYAKASYDALGRAITLTDPAGSVSVARYGVDVNGTGYTGTNLALKTTIDPNGHQKQQVTDGLGRMLIAREFDGTGPYTLTAETRYTYDAADRLTKVVDALGNTTTITYDALGRKVGMIDPDMGIWTYAYSPLGQLISQTDALRQTQWFGYDGLGRMTEKRIGGPRARCWSATSTTRAKTGSGGGPR